MAVDDGVLPGGRPWPAGPLQEVAEGGDVLGQGHSRDRPSLEGDRPGQPLPSSLDQSEAVESGCVSGNMGERGAELPLRARVVASRDEKLAELQRRPGRRFGAGHGGLGGQPHGGDRAGTVAEQLSRVRDAGVGGEARLEPRQLVEGRERLAVAAELDERVADGAERPRLRGRELAGASREDERLAEAVARERERGEAGERDGALLVQLERPPQHRLGARVVGRVAGLARALLVGEPEQRVRRGVVGALPNLLLEAKDERRRRSEPTRTPGRMPPPRARPEAPRLRPTAIPATRRRTARTRRRRREWRWL